MNNSYFQLLNVSTEQVWLQLIIRKLKIGIGIVYKPPNFSYADFLSNFETALSIVDSDSNKIYCLGDFNITLLEFGSTDSKNVNAILDGVGFKQIIQGPTKITQTSDTLIDYVLMTEKENVSSD